MASAIEIRSLSKIFGPDAQAHLEAVRNGLGKAQLNARTGHVLALRDVNLTMPAGQITVVMGLSGSGKSTLIRHINRLIEPTAGFVLVDGVDVCRLSEVGLRAFRRSRTAMVFQKFALLPHRTVLENVGYGLKLQGLEGTERTQRARRWIDRVGLSGFEDRYPNQLSGGMQQRVGLARALATDADILLLDEAFSALDPLIRVDMQTMLLDLQRELGKTVVFITHDLDEALRLGDRIAILRDGEVIQQGTGEAIVLRPADDYIAAFVREVNRGRLLRVSAVLSKDPAPAGSPTIEADTVLELAVRRMLDASSQAARVTESGRPIGSVTLTAVLAAMVPPSPSGAPAEFGDGLACAEGNDRPSSR